MDGSQSIFTSSPAMPVLAPARISHMRSVCWGRFMLEHFHVDIRTDTSNNRRYPSTDELIEE
ncbi:hypothetical protein VDGL01_12668 [Verticillium dahliae]